MISLSPDPFSRKKITSVTFGNLYTYVCVSVCCVQQCGSISPFFFCFLFMTQSLIPSVEEKFENKTIQLIPIPIGKEFLGLFLRFCGCSSIIYIAVIWTNERDWGLGMSGGGYRVALAPHSRELLLYCVLGTEHQKVGCRLGRRSHESFAHQLRSFVRSALFFHL